MTDRVPDYKRTIVVTFRVSASEHAVLIDAAARAKLPPSTYARHAALSVPITVKVFQSFAPEDVAQLKRLGNLLNQIARAIWRGRFFPATEAHLGAVLAELRQVLRTLMHVRPVP